jgi:ABC transport system ATP-binding/permease protein
MPPPPWNVPPAPAWSAPAASAAPAVPSQPPASTDADLAAGAHAAAEEPVAPSAPQIAPPPWRGPDNNEVAATMVAPPPMGGGAEREPTTVMPAWQPPPTAPPVPETMAMPARTQPLAGVSAGPQAELTIESGGPDAGHTHRATDTAVRLGRSPDNDVILRDPATSGHHARLERRGNDFWIVDLGSTNGTFVNGESVQEKQLNHGDRLTVGQNTVHFSLVGA